MGADTWAMLADERKAFVAYAETIPPDAFDTPSPCDGWRVQELMAHLYAGCKSTPPKFIASMIGSGFNVEKALHKQMLAQVGHTPEELVAGLLAEIGTHNQPPMTMVGEVIVHGEDVRAALGAPTGDHPTAHLTAVADHYKKAGGPIQGKARTAGLMLRATDADWSAGRVRWSKARCSRSSSP